MTRDEVLAMKPGRELDALVAEKVMGWTNFSPIDPKYDHAVGVNGYRRNFARRPNKDRDEPIPLYSSDISAAFEVVDKLHATGKYNLALEYYPNEKDWGADFDEWGVSSQAVAATAQEAIVKAALLAVMDL